MIRIVRRSKFRQVAAAVAIAIAAVASSGCPTRKDLDAMPGLADARPIGPKGQKCYDFCAQSEASCKHMCPRNTAVGDCEYDCVVDTKLCLKDCPELQRPISTKPD